MKDVYLSFGKDRGEIDFSISGSVCSLTYEEMKNLRAMIVVGIGAMESMWSHANQASPQQVKADGEK